MKSATAAKRSCSTTPATTSNGRGTRFRSSTASRAIAPFRSISTTAASSGHYARSIPAPRQVTDDAIVEMFIDLRQGRRRDPLGSAQPSPRRTVGSATRFHSWRERLARGVTFAPPASAASSACRNRDRSALANGAGPPTAPVTRVRGCLGLVQAFRSRPEVPHRAQPEPPCPPRPVVRVDRRIARA